LSEQPRPEIGTLVVANGIRTNYLEAGVGAAVVLVHGSGPGVTAYANWRLTIPRLASKLRVLAPDMVGFGFTERPERISYGLDTWVSQLVGFLDALGLEQASVVGNSFGGAIALRLTARYPDRVDRLVLMGSAGVPFELTPGLDAVWGYQPSVPAMRRLLDIFAHDRSLVDDELAEVRYRTSVEQGFQEAFEQMFPAPRQRWVDSLVTPDAELSVLPHRTMIVHGREDAVIPLSNSLHLMSTIPNSRLHVFGHCGHWTQIEQEDAFASLAVDFLTAP
jgi:pimeloyl-ACP methyl ester carboxylesterase